MGGGKANYWMARVGHVLGKFLTGDEELVIGGGAFEASMVTDHANIAVGAFQVYLVAQ